MEKKYYIAYGSNLNVRQMKYRCKEAKVVGTARIDDYRLLYKGSLTGSFLTIEPAKGYSVPVGVWAVCKDDESALDRYEGYPNFYYKKGMELEVTNIETGKVSKEKVFVYIMHEERRIGIPSEFYVQVCEEGYRNFGFDKAVLDQALKFSKEKAKWQK